MWLVIVYFRFGTNHVEGLLGVGWDLWNMPYGFPARLSLLCLLCSLGILEVVSKC